jgi:antitoxin ParD1/3/4
MRQSAPDRGRLPKFAGYADAMSTMNISLPDSLKAFVDEQVSDRGYGTSSEYVRELIRKDQDQQHLRGLLLTGAASESAAPVDDAYFDKLRQACASGQRSSQGVRAKPVIPRQLASRHVEGAVAHHAA